MADFKMDIFGLVTKINNPSSGDVYASLSDLEKKGFFPLVVMRWLSGTNNEAQILALNDFANKAIFPLGKHPHLLMLLLQACSPGTGGRPTWLGIKGGSKKTQLRNQVLMEFFDISINEVRAMTVFPTDAEIIGMAEEIGFQDDEMKKLKKEIKDASAQ